MEMIREVILYGAMFWLIVGYNYRKDTINRNLFFGDSELIKCNFNSSLVIYSRIKEESVLECIVKCSERPDCGHVIFCGHSQFCYLEDDNGLYYDWTNFLKCSCYDSRELKNVAMDSYCEASSVYVTQHICNKALDGKGDSGNPWTSDNQGVGAWIKIYLRNTRLLTHARIMQKRNLSMVNKEIQLEFSDQSFQVFVLPLPTTSGFFWDDLYLQPVRTSWVNITVLSVYSAGKNGWREIELFSPS